MRTLLKNASVFTRDGFIRHDILICDSHVSFDISENEYSADTVYDLNGLLIIPGLCDVHVHLREPGFSYKETIKTGTEAAAHGGYTAVCAMPNLSPVPSTPENLKIEQDIIDRDALVHVYPFGSITMERKGSGALSMMEALAPKVCGFSDDGTGVQEESVMRQAMVEAARLGRVISAHCEDNRELRPGGCIHDGEYARLYNHVGINSASEWKQVERDVKLAEETGVHYHVCHVSTKESVEIIREAKKRGVHVTCETGPHYLMFTDMDLKESGDWKMNPPIRDASDRHALLEGIKDGTIDCIITDHAPHSAEEKAKGLDKSAFGIVGLETCFAAMYQNLVLHDPEHPDQANAYSLPEASHMSEPDEDSGARRADGQQEDSTTGSERGNHGVISLGKLIELMCVKPRRVFGLPGPQYIEDGCVADLSVVDLGKQWIVDPDKFYSMGKSTLFKGMKLQGEIVKTFVSGREAYDRERGIIN